MEEIPTVHQDIPPAVAGFSLETPISRLGFSQRSFKALTKSGYSTVAQLLTLDEEALWAIKNLGKKSIREIRIVQAQLQRQLKPAAVGRFKHVSVPDCRFIYTRETIYPTDYIGVLDISIEAHTILYNAGIFSAGTLFNLEKEAVYNLAKTTKKISEELLAFIAREKPLAGKIFGDEDLAPCLQKRTEERRAYRMAVLEESYSKIPRNRLSKPLSLFLHGKGAKTIRRAAARLSPLLTKVKTPGDLKTIFPLVAETSLSGDVIRLQEALAFNLIDALNKTFTPFFIDPRNAASLDILYQRASGFTLQDIARKRNLTRERIRQIEIKSADKLVDIIKDFPVNILAFICTETESSDYISAGSIREYLGEFRYNSQIVYLLENENIYKEYRYDRRHDVFYRAGVDLDLFALDTTRSVKEQALNEKEVEIGKKIENLLVAKNRAPCAYDDICQFTDSEACCVRVGKIIQRSNNIVEIERRRYVHRSRITGIDEAAVKLLAILQNQFRRFHGYSSSRILFDAARRDLALFMHGNGLETEAHIYMLAKHLFSKEKINGRHFYFTEGLHIWENQTGVPLNNKGILINLANVSGGIIIREEVEKYLENLKISKNIIITKIHDTSDPTFYFYTETSYVLSKYLQIDGVFIANVKKALDIFFEGRDYIIPEHIDEGWFEKLPQLPLGLSWNVLLLQEVIRYNEAIGYKPLFSCVEQSPYRLSGAFVKKDSAATLIDIIYAYTHKNFGLPYRTSTDKYRVLLRQAGFIHGAEWFTSMHKVFNDPRFAFSNGNKNIL
ncbi:MAG: hypothetical protein LBH70_11005, partial [Spirochaetaceae bacterium]|nr:hypothetical protein [Spirochaetaceae bacterium]